MPQNLTIAIFAFGAVLLLVAITSGGFKIFGTEMSGANGRLSRIAAAVLGFCLIGVAVWPTIGPKLAAPAPAQPIPPSQVQGPSQTQPPTPAVSLPAGTVAAGEDSLQILDVSPAPGTYMHTGQAQTFRVVVAYSLASADTAILAMSVSQIRQSAAGCSSPSGELTDASQVAITRGQRTLTMDVSWSGDSAAATKGRQFGSGYLTFAPSFWQNTNGQRGDRIDYFTGYSSVCYPFGP
jgi:hypothetical protein